MNKVFTLKTASLAGAFGILFLVLLASLHILEPEFDPSWRMISEYELGKYGWLMSIAFFCWGGGFLSLTLASWQYHSSITGKVGKYWLLIISIALFGAGIFYPQPITDTIRGTMDKLHAMCGVTMIFTLPIAAILFVKSLVKNKEFKEAKAGLFVLTTLLWIGLLAFITASAIYKPEARLYNENTLIGWPNRFLVLTYTIWLIGVARLILQTSK